MHNNKKIIGIIVGLVVAVGISYGGSLIWKEYSLKHKGIDPVAFFGHGGGGSFTDAEYAQMNADMVAQGKVLPIPRVTGENLEATKNSDLNQGLTPMQAHGVPTVEWSNQEEDDYWYKKFKDEGRVVPVPYFEDESSGGSETKKVPGSGSVAHNTVMQKSRDNYTKPSDSDIKSMLTSLQYNVTQKEGTEQPYNNAYRDNHAAGIYVDIVSGEPLFSSTDKYDSQTGRPSFTKPLVTANVVTKTDADGSRTEVRSKHADSHLGHLFDDGPAPLGTRYCMNSAAMKFIPVADLEKEGYGEFSYLFK